jgi:two-component system response regulator
VVDGAEALDFLFARGKYEGRNARIHPKVVLLDLKLPKVDGMEVLRSIRADANLKHTPVVVLTSSKEERDVATTYGLGVNSYIQKPVEFDAFAEVVSQLGLYWLVVNHAPAFVAPSKE